MVNSIAAVENPQFEEALRNVMLVARSVLMESLRKGYFGKVDIEISVHDGVLNHIRSLHERSYTVKRERK